MIATQIAEDAAPHGAQTKQALGPKGHESPTKARASTPSTSRPTPKSAKEALKLTPQASQAFEQAETKSPERMAG